MDIESSAFGRAGQQMLPTTSASQARGVVIRARAALDSSYHRR
ncbi:hypothetical protein ACRJ4W_13330 [Streptomyces sp. GLT-R25]